MSLPTRLVCPSTGVDALITEYGELVVGGVGYDEVVSQELGATLASYNFYSPKDGCAFVITGIRIKADRQVSTTVDGLVTIFENGVGPTGTAKDKTLYTEALVRGESATLTGIRILVNEGVWINANTTDDDMYVTIMGHYIKKRK